MFRDWNILSFYILLYWSIQCSFKISWHVFLKIKIVCFSRMFGGQNVMYYHSCTFYLIVWNLCKILYVYDEYETWSIHFNKYPTIFFIILISFLPSSLLPSSSCFILLAWLLIYLFVNCFLNFRDLYMIRPSYIFRCNIL